MRLAINAIPLTEGGGLTGLVGYSRALRDAGVELVVFASRSKTIDAVRALGVEVVPAVQDGSLYQRTAWQLWKLPGELVRRRCELLMMTNSSLPRCPVPQLIHHRNLWAFESPGDEIPDFGGPIKLYAIRSSARRAMQAAAANVFVSKYLRQAAERIVPDADGKNHVICNGLDESIFAIPSASLESHRSPLICAVQPNNTQKDNPTLLRAFAELVRMAPEVDWRLVIAGGGEWARHRALAASLGVLPRVQWAGHLDSACVRDLYDKSHCLMFTSYFESFGNPPLEAMARGCPVIAVNATAMPEVIGDAGILVSRGDSIAFAQAALTLWRDVDARRRLVELGYRRAAQFSWTRSAEKLLAVMKGICPAARSAVVGV